METNLHWVGGRPFAKIKLYIFAKNIMVSSRQVDGETRIGVFAGRSIEVGEPLTYDYRYV